LTSISFNSLGICFATSSLVLAWLIDSRILTARGLDKTFLCNAAYETLDVSLATFANPNPVIIGQGTRNECSTVPTKPAFFNPFVASLTKDCVFGLLNKEILFLKFVAAF